MPYWPRDLSPRRRIASIRRYNNDSRELEVKTAAQPFWGLLRPLNQQAKKGVTVLAVVTDPNYQGKVGLLLSSGDKKKYVWNARDFLGFAMLCN